MAVKVRPSDEVVQANIKKWNIPQPDREYTVLVHCSTYNHGPYIEDALKGFVMQKTNFPFCAIIIDDCSTDNNAEIIQKYAEKYPDIIKPILLGENHMQHGLLRDPYFEKWHQSAKYIAECEGDDYWIDPLKLQKQVSFLEENPDYGMAYSKAKIQVGNKLSGTYGTSDTSFESLLFYSNFPTVTRVYRKSLHDKYFWDINPSSHKWMMGDYPWAFYIASHSKIKYFDEYFAVYRILESSASHGKDKDYLFKFYDSADDVRCFFINRYEKFDDTQKAYYLKLIKKNNLLYKLSYYIYNGYSREANCLYQNGSEILGGQEKVKWWLMLHCRPFFCLEKMKKRVLSLLSVLIGKFSKATRK